MMTAGTQHVIEVLDLLYTPKTKEDADLFQLKQEYMYNIADNILQTDRGIVYVGEHDMITTHKRSSLKSLLII